MMRTEKQIRASQLKMVLEELIEQIECYGEGVFEKAMEGKAFGSVCNATHETEWKLTLSVETHRLDCWKCHGTCESSSGAQCSACNGSGKAMEKSDVVD